MAVSLSASQLGAEMPHGPEDDPPSKGAETQSHGATQYQEQDGEGGPLVQATNLTSSA